MLRSKSVQPLYGRPAHTKVEYLGDKTNAKTNSPYQVAKLFQLHFVRGVEHELRLWVDENAILEPAPSKHDSRLDMRILG